MSLIRIESKNVVLNGQDTGFNHSYLLLDGNGTADSEDVQVRGDDGTDGAIAIQSGLPIEDSADARRGASPDYRGDVVVSSAHADGQWSLMLQAAQQIADAHITYTFPGQGVAVQNSNSVVATLLHTVGLDIADHLPTNASMAELTGAETVLDFGRNLTGGADDDTIVGWHQDDVLAGGYGNDMLVGDAGNDTLYGNQGDDTLYGNTGNDTLYGGQGDDLLYGGQGDDVLHGNLGDDVLEGGLGSNQLFGDGGTNTASYVHAAAGVTASLALAGQVQDTGGAGQDLFVDIQNLTGSRSADTLTGDAGANVIDAGAGDDTVSAGAGNDTVLGADGNDTLYGNQGADHIVGGDGDDTLYGGQNDDALEGGAGADLLQGGLGADTLTGGAGADLFRYVTIGDSTPGAPDLVTDFESGTDKIDLSALHLTAADTLTIATSDNTTLVSVDLGGDGSSDMLIQVAGANAVTATDVWGAPPSAGANASIAAGHAPPASGDEHNIVDRMPISNLMHVEHGLLA